MRANLSFAFAILALILAIIAIVMAMRQKKGGDK
jgi:hypothetical protein